MAGDSSRICALCKVDHPYRTLATRETFARCSNISALDAHKTRVSCTSVGVITHVSIASVTSLASAAVLSWALMVAGGVLVAVVFIQLAWVDLLTHGTCACRYAAEVAPAVIA